MPFAFVTAIGWGLFFFALIYPTRHIGPWLSAFLTEVGVTFAAGVHLIVSKQKTQLQQVTSRPVIVNGVCLAIGTAAFTYGVSRYNPSIVTALNTATALPATLMAAYFFKEHLNRLEKSASALMITAVLLISI